jgi:phosphate uptake regulator
MDIVQHSIIAWYLEMIGDRVNNIAQKIIKLQQIRGEADDELLDRLTQIGMIAFTMYDKAVKSVFDKNLNVASDAVDLYETVANEESNLLKRFQNGSSQDVNAYVSEIAWDLKIIAEHSSAIAEIAIDNVLKGENDICNVSNDVKDHVD